MASIARDDSSTLPGDELCEYTCLYDIRHTEDDFFALVSRLAEYKLENLAVYGRGSMGVPVGELQYGR